MDVLRKRMLDEGVDLVVLGPVAHLARLTDVRSHADERALLFCVTAKHVGFLMPSLEADCARRQTELPFFEWSDADGPGQALDAMLNQFGMRAAHSIVIDETMRADHAALVQDRLTDARRQVCETTLGALRARKDVNEYARLKNNAHIADRAMQDAWASMQVGMTEAEVAAVVHKSFKDADTTPLFTIVGAGSIGVMPHHHTGDTVLSAGDAVVMDIGAGARAGRCCTYRDIRCRIRRILRASSRSWHGCRGP